MQAEQSTVHRLRKAKRYGTLYKKDLVMKRKCTFNKILKYRQPSGGSIHSTKIELDWFEFSRTFIIHEIMRWQYVCTCVHVWIKSVI